MHNIELSVHFTYITNQSSNLYRVHVQWIDIDSVIKQCSSVISKPGPGEQFIHKQSDIWNASRDDKKHRKLIPSDVELTWTRHIRVKMKNDERGGMGAARGGGRKSRRSPT